MEKWDTSQPIIRKPKPNDQQLCQKAYELLMDLLQKNQPEIESALWVGPMIAAISDAFLESGVPYKDFKDQMRQAVKHYKY